MPRYIREKLTDKEQGLLGESFNGLVFQNQDAKHPHPVLHYSRKFLEQEAMDKLRDLGVASVLDIGGNAARAGSYAAKTGLLYHSTNPILDTSDAIRGKLHEMQHGGMVSYCRHRVEECLCMPVHDALLSVHSLYYFEPETLVQLIARTQRKLLVGVVHLFEGYSGNFPVGTKESHWELVGRNVTMTANGNPHVYFHSALLWLHGGGVATPSGNLAWTFLKEACGSALIVFTTTLATVPRSPLSDLRPGTRLDQRDLRGLRNVQATINYQYRELDVKDVIVAKFGLIIDTELDRTVVIPNELLSEAKLWVVGKERSQANWGLLINNLRGKIGKLNVHHSMTSDVVLLCAALAYTETVHPELQALVMLSRYSSQFGVLKLWTGIPVIHWHTIAVGLATLVGATAFVVSRNVGRPQLTLVPNHMSTFVGIRAVSGSMNWSSVLWVMGAIGATLLGYFGLTKYVTVKSAASTVPSQYSTRPDLELLYEKPKVGTIVTMPDLHDKKEKAGYTPVVTVNGIVPVRCANDNATIVHALMARMLKGTEEADWSHIVAKRDKWDKWFGPKAHLEILPFERWIVEQYNRSKDKPRVAQLQKAYHELVSDPTLLKFEIQPFVKNEAYVGKGANPKPRMILATNDYYLVATGPVCSALSADLKRRWHKNHFIYYTSGATAKDLGEWFSRGCQRFPDGVLVWMDMSEFEARITEECMETEAKIDQHITDISNDYVDLLLMQVKQVGKTRSGLRWKRRAGRSSGVGNTSEGNSKANGTVSAECYDRYDLPLEDHVQMGVLGDDNLCFLSSHMWDRLGKTIQPIEDAYKQVGWLPVGDWCPVSQYHQAEYCSGWFTKVDYPADVEDRPQTYTWTPKVGRVLAKSFQLKPSEQNGPGVIRGIAIGLSCGPVDPLLYAFCSTLDKTLKEVQPVQWVQSEYNPLIVRTREFYVDPVSTCDRYGLTMEQFKRVEEYLKSKAAAWHWPINLSTDECPEWELIDQKDIEYADLFDETSTNDDESQVKPNTTAMDRKPIERVPDLHKHPRQERDGTPIVNQPNPKREPKPGKRERANKVPAVEVPKEEKDVKNDPNNNNRPQNPPVKTEGGRGREQRGRARLNRGGSRRGRGGNADSGANYRPRRGTRGGASAVIANFDYGVAWQLLRKFGSWVAECAFVPVCKPIVVGMWNAFRPFLEICGGTAVVLGVPRVMDLMVAYNTWWTECAYSYTPFYFATIVGEELIKGESSRWGLGFALAELVFTKSLLVLSGFLPPRVIWLMIPAVVMHVTNAHGPLWRRVVRHLIFNAVMQLAIGPFVWWAMGLPCQPLPTPTPVMVEVPAGGLA